MPQKDYGKGGKVLYFSTFEDTFSFLLVEQHPHVFIFHSRPCNLCSQPCLALVICYFQLGLSLAQLSEIQL